MVLDGVKVNYGILDQTIETDTITGEATGETSNSNISNTLSKTTKTKLAYLEKDYFLLDGSFIFPLQDTRYNVGWESDSIADEAGNILERITYFFGNKHDSYGVQIGFPAESIAKDFTISYYNGDTIVGSVVVTDNNNQIYSNYNTNLQWNKVVVIFTKVNPLQRARLNDITFGINDTYDEDLLVSITASQAIGLAGDYDESGEFSFEFFNEGRFNIKDLGDLPIGLQEGLEVVVYTKAKGESEYKLFGHYFSSETSVQENGKIVSVSGYDDLYFLNDTVFGKGIVYPKGRSLKAWAEEVAQDANISIVVDDVFDNIISTGYITEVPHREALRLIAEAGNGVLRLDPTGKLFLEKHNPTYTGNISKDNIVDETKQTQNFDKILGIDVARFSFSQASSEQELGYIEEIGLTEEPQDIEIVYADYPAVVDTVQVFVDTTSSAVISNLQIYSDRVVVSIMGDEGDTTFITVTGYPYNQATTNVTRGSVVKNIKKIENNYLITGSIAESVADYQFEKVVNKFNRSAEVITDLPVALGDEIILEEDNIYVTKRMFSVSYEDQAQTVEGLDK